jgi:hypothetical protein
MVRLFVTRDVDLKIAPGPLTEGLVRTFAVVGPSLAVGCVQREAGSADSSLGLLSPKAAITLKAEVKRLAGIPDAATHFAFMHPLSCFADRMQKLVQQHAVHKPSWLDALLIGAFVYFSESDEVLRINALALGASPNFLFLDGPHDCSAASFGHLEDHDRAQPVTLSHLRAAGLCSFAWVVPSEQPGGAPLNRRVGVPSGAFAFGALPNGAAEPAHYFWRVALSLPPVQATSALSSAFESAFGSMQQIAADAEEEQQKLSADVAEHARSPLEVWLRTHLLRLVGYYMAGCLVYTHLEGWHSFDVVYFLTTTATTVGYGDLAPRSALGRAFTIVYAPVGCLYVIGAIMPIVHALIRVFEARAMRLALAAQGWIDRTLSSSTAGRSGHSSGRSVIVIVDGERVAISASMQYMIVLLGPVILLLCLVGVAYVLIIDEMTSINVEVERSWSAPVRLVEAVYFAVVTATTIGYGSITPTTWQAKLALVVLMPLATAALAAAMSSASKIATRRAIRAAKYHLKARELLLDDATGDPSAELTKGDFLLVVLKAYDLVDAGTLETISKEFDKLVHAPVASGASAEDRLEATLNAKVLFHHLRQQKSILHHNLELGASGGARAAQAQESRGSPLPRRQNSEGVVRVDMSRPDHGFSEWYTRFWVPAVRERGVRMFASRGPSSPSDIGMVEDLDEVRRAPEEKDDEDEEERRGRLGTPPPTSARHEPAQPPRDEGGCVAPATDDARPCAQTSLDHTRTHANGYQKLHGDDEPELFEEPEDSDGGGGEHDARLLQGCQAEDASAEQMEEEGPSLNREGADDRLGMPPSHSRPCCAPTPHRAPLSSSFRASTHHAGASSCTAVPLPPPRTTAQYRMQLSRQSVPIVSPLETRGTRVTVKLRETPLTALSRGASGEGGEPTMAARSATVAKEKAARAVARGGAAAAFDAAWRFNA